MVSVYLHLGKELHAQNSLPAFTLFLATLFISGDEYLGKAFSESA